MIDGRHAHLKDGRADNPTAVFSLAAPDFVRIVATDLGMGEALHQSRLTIEGDVMSALTASRMFLPTLGRRVVEVHPAP